MKILIVGATGKTGQALLTQLSASEHAVFGSIRTPEQAAQITQFNAKPIIADLEKDVSTLAQGFDAIIFVAGSNGKRVQTVDYEGVIKVVNSAEQHHVSRLLYLSSSSVGKSVTRITTEMTAAWQKHPNSFPERYIQHINTQASQDYLACKLKAEQSIINAQLDYTILRCGALLQSAGSGKIQLYAGQADHFGVLSRANLATCFINILNNTATFRKIYTVFDGDVPITQAFAQL